MSNLVWLTTNNAPVVNHTKLDIDIETFLKRKNVNVDKEEFLKANKKAVSDGLNEIVPAVTCLKIVNNEIFVEYVECTWAERKVACAYAPDLLGTLGAGAVLISGNNVLISVRHPVMETGGVLHTSANEGVTCADLDTCVLTWMQRAVKEELGATFITKNVNYYLFRNEIKNSWAICAIVEVNELNIFIQTVKTAADGWEGDPFIVSKTKLTQILTQNTNVSVLLKTLQPAIVS